VSVHACACTSLFTNKNILSMCCVTCVHVQVGNSSGRLNAQ